MNKNSSGVSKAVQRLDGSIDTRALTELLRVPAAELAASVGLSLEEFLASSRQEDVHRRLAGLVRILDSIEAWAGNPRTAYAWFRSQPICSFGGMTGEDLLKAGRVDSLEGYVNRIAMGGYT